VAVRTAGGDLYKGLDGQTAAGAYRRRKVRAPQGRTLAEADAPQRAFDQREAPREGRRKVPQKANRPFGGWESLQGGSKRPRSRRARRPNET
jgi:hypothetical protein